MGLRSLYSRCSSTIDSKEKAMSYPVLQKVASRRIEHARMIPEDFVRSKVRRAAWHAQNRPFERKQVDKPSIFHFSTGATRMAQHKCIPTHSHEDRRTCQRWFGKAILSTDVFRKDCIPIKKAGLPGSTLSLLRTDSIGLPRIHRTSKKPSHPCG